MSNYILPTYTGIQFDLLEPTIDMIDIRDIAHHLAQINRFCGAAKFPYSVAYHSINVCKQLPDEIKLEGLLHDAEEAYIHDLTAPFKHLLRALSKEDYLSHYDNKAAEISLLVGDKFHLHSDEESFGYGNKLVDIADKRMATTEIKQLITNFPEENWAHDYLTAESYDNVIIMNLSFDNVERLFLEAYNRYKRV